MNTRKNKLAVYTTIYPASLKYAAEWFQSVQAQTAADFELWIGLDALTQKEVETELGSHVEAHWVETPAGSTPAQIRHRSLRQIVSEGYDVVLVDSDDVLHPCRVAAAREALNRTGLTACALEIVNEGGQRVGAEFNLDPACNPSQILPRNNIFGFSNSAYRCELLERCLPIPDDAKLVDWYLATRAWLLGGDLGFDRSVRMRYRQYGFNTARLTLPFLADQILSDLALVRRHFELVLATADREYYLPGRWQQFLGSAHDIEQFEHFVTQGSTNLSKYVELLNHTVRQPIWWTSVAYAPLAYMWKQGRDQCRQ